MTVEALQVPVYRPFPVRVARLQRLSPSFLRVTFTGPDMADFASNGFDQRIKVMLPLPGRGIEPIRLDSTKAGPGHYVVGAAALAPAGDWRLELVARISDFDELRTTYEVPIE